MRTFLCALFFSTTTIMFKCKSSQAPKSSNHDDVSNDDVIRYILEQFLEQYFLTLDKRVVLKAVRLRLFWVGRGSIDISTLYEVPSNEQTLQYQSVISFFTSLPVKIFKKFRKNGIQKYLKNLFCTQLQRNVILTVTVLWTMIGIGILDFHILSWVNHYKRGWIRMIWG